MRAVVYRGANDLRLERLPVPRIRPDELLVRVDACGVCPTDIKKIHQGTLPPPRVFGHETAGTIARIGSRVRDWRIGDRVGLHHHIPCLNCHACRHRAFAQCAQYKRTGITAGFEPAGGGYAEFVRVMPFVLPGIVRIPSRNTAVEGAMLEPVNTVLKAVRRLPLQTGDRVWVIGQGPIGLLFTRLLALESIEVFASDLMPERLRIARKWGAHRVLRADAPDFDLRMRRFAGRAGFDAVIVTVPSNAVLEPAQALVRGGGQVLLFAHTKRGDVTALDPAGICVDEKDIIGSYSSDFTLQRDVARLVFSRRLDVRSLISHLFPLEETATAVDLAAQPASGSLKIMVCPAALPAALPTSSTPSGRKVAIGPAKAALVQAL
jgi:L-iditol 2-dehydrogenase